MTFLASGNCDIFVAVQLYVARAARDYLAVQRCTCDSALHMSIESIQYGLLETIILPLLTGILLMRVSFGEIGRTYVNRFSTTYCF